MYPPSYATYFIPPLSLGVWSAMRAIVTHVYFLYANASANKTAAGSATFQFECACFLHSIDIVFVCVMFSYRKLGDLSN